MLQNPARTNGTATPILIVMADPTVNISEAAAAAKSPIVMRAMEPSILAIGANRCWPA